METDIDPASAGHQEIRLLVDEVIESSKIPAKTRATNVKPAVASLTSLSYEWGLLPGTLDDLIILVTTPNHLDQASQAAIIRNLYPVAPISRKSVLQVISCLGHGALKPSLTLQAALLKWLITVHHTLESPQTLSQTYSVLFNLLDTAATRPNLSHLLALITRRKHVQPFRIQALLNLSRQTGNDPSLIGLLRVFKDYYPEVIVGDAVRGKASSFKHVFSLLLLLIIGQHPDPQWRARLDEIQDAHLHQTEKGTLRPRDGFRVHRPIARSTRNRIIPVVHTSYVAENAVTLEEIENVASFVKNLDKLELPNQLVAVLADPLLQKLMLLRPDGESEQRLANWLNGALQDVRDGDADENTFFDMLDILREYVVSIKNLPPLLLDFFARFLPLWDGSGRRDAMFEILSHSPLLDFKGLYKHIFQPLEAATLDNTPESLLALLALYKNLLHHWTIVLESSDTVPDHASGTITALVRHVNPLALTLCQTCPSVSSRSAILDFYEQNARLVSHQVLKHYICIELPPSSLIYILFFSSSVAIVSRMCAILAFYKKGFEMAMLTRPGREKSNRIDSTSYNRTFVSLFNGYLMDIISLLIVTLATPELAKQTMY
ncbi:Centromere protein I [Fusarium odoratissimum]|uniref:Centromere protein I n=1 Tax=Fusarium oxysporum f. sp. cubense (strain race 4) TaxID=2502994 RepID=N1RHM8_FUSC4|nr:Centromere protein I [Fusarium odoratissimum]